MAPQWVSLVILQPCYEFLLVLCSRLWKISWSWNAHCRRASGGQPGALAVAGQSAGYGESPVWRFDHHAIVDRHSCSLRSGVSPRDVSFVFVLFIFISLLLSDVLSSFCRLPSPSQWEVYAGYLTLSQMYLSTSNSVSQVIAHSGFDPETNTNDIALMKLRTPLQMSSELQYKRNYEVSSQKNNMHTQVYSWGQKR